MEQYIADNNETLSEPDSLHEYISIDQAKEIIEAILFAAGYPVEYKKLASVLGFSLPETKKIISDFATDYNNPDSIKGIQLLMFEDSCQLCTKEQYEKYVRSALGLKSGGNLSKSSLEVLAIIAYNTPVTKAFVEQVRGVDCTYAISNLLGKGLIRNCGRLDAPGRPMLYEVTEEFLRVFGLASIKDLPEIDLQLAENTNLEQISLINNETSNSTSSPINSSEMSSI